MSRERQIDTVIMQKLYMSPAGTPKEVRAITGGYRLATFQIVSMCEGDTGPILRFTVPVAIARLYYRVQGTRGRRDLHLASVNEPANPGYTQ